MKSYSFVICGAFGHESVLVGSKKHLEDALRSISDFACPGNASEMFAYFAECAWKNRKHPDSAAVAELWSNSLGAWSVAILRPDVDFSYKVRERVRVYSCKKYVEHAVRYESEPEWRRINAGAVASLLGG